MSFIPFTEKIKKKKWNMIRWSDPHQNEADPKHCWNLINITYLL